MDYKDRWGERESRHTVLSLRLNDESHIREKYVEKKKKKKVCCTSFYIQTSIVLFIIWNVILFLMF